MTENDELTKRALRTKVTEKGGKTLKRRVRKRKKKTMSRRAKKAWELYLENPAVSKEAAAIAAGYAPGNGARVLDPANMPRQIIEALGAREQVTDAEVAHNIALHLRANLVDKESLGVPKLNPAQLDMFEKNWFDAEGNPKTGMRHVRPDLDRRNQGVKLLLEVAKAGADPEYGKKMFENGLEAASQQYVALIEGLRAHLSEEGQRVLAERVAAMGGRN